MSTDPFPGGKVPLGLLTTPTIYLRYAAVLEKHGEFGEALWVREFVARWFPEHK